MHTSTRLRLAALGLVALAVLLALPGGALAAKPTFHDKFTETFPDTICDVDGTSTISVTQVVTLTDTSVKVTGQVSQVFTADDGRSVRLHSAGQFTDTFTDNGDGTVTFTTTYKGLPEQIKGAKGGVVTRDAGIISFITTVDPNSGDVTTIVQHGPHPEADSDFTLFCTAFLSALG